MENLVEFPLHHHRLSCRSSTRVTRFKRGQGSCSFKCCDEEGIPPGSPYIQMTPAEIPFPIQLLKMQEPCPPFHMLSLAEVLLHLLPKEAVHNSCTSVPCLDASKSPFLLKCPSHVGVRVLYFTVLSFSFRFKVFLVLAEHLKSHGRNGTRCGEGKQFNNGHWGGAQIRKPRSVAQTSTAPSSTIVGFLAYSALPPPVHVRSPGGLVILSLSFAPLVLSTGGFRLASTCTAVPPAGHPHLPDSGEQAEELAGRRRSRSSSATVQELRGCWPAEHGTTSCLAACLFLGSPSRLGTTGGTERLPWEELHRPQRGRFPPFPLSPIENTPIEEQNKIN